MSQMNAGIILQGQTPDIMGNFSSGMAVRSQQNALAQQENLSNLYRTQGAQILAGDQQALNALAGIDPNAALGVQQGRLGMDATRHGMKMDEANLGLRQQELAITKENARMRGLEFAAQMDAQTAAQTAAELERAIAMGSQAQTPEQWDAVMAQLGEDGQQYVGQFENRDMIIAGALGLKEALAMGAGGQDMPADFQSLRLRAEASGLQEGTPEYQDFMRQGSGGGLPAAFVALDLQAKAAGFEPGTPDYQEFMATRGAGLQAQAKVEGTAAGEAVTGLGSAIAKGEQALALIDQVANDPSLPSILGIIQGNIPAGTPFIGGGQAGADLGVKIEQLQGQVFLEAFESLKGGGAITEIEGQKAERAKARLQRTQSPEAYRAALGELRDVIENGMIRAQERAENARGNLRGASGSSAATGATTDFSTMGLAEIGQVDIGSLTPAEMDALEARMTELGL
jgi:hypothetical protein